MKKHLILLFFLLFLSIVGTAQENLDAQKGLRIIRGTTDHIIYADKDFEPNQKDYRKINYRVFFRKLDYPVKDLNGKKFQLITIPGTSNIKDEEKAHILPNGKEVYPRSGKTIDQPDYDQNFWIEVEIIDTQTNPEYFKYANDYFSGLLTAPFKYRLKVGNAPESLIDGDFNLSPFLGWKWRVSSVNPFYVAAFGFGGVTSLNYNSGNNEKITDPEQLENGTGLTYGFGISIKLGNVSPGFIIGWDKGIGNLGSGFNYNDYPWLSFSVNYDFFKSKIEEKGTGN